MDYRYIRRRRVVVTYEKGGKFHRKTFKDCSIIQASDLFKVLALIYDWTYIDYYFEDY